MTGMMQSSWLSIKRQGPADNTLASSRTQYFAACLAVNEPEPDWSRLEEWDATDLPKEVASVQLPWDKHKYLENDLRRLDYGAAANDADVLLEKLGSEVAKMLDPIPGFGEAVKRATVDAPLHLQLDIDAQELLMVPFELSFAPDSADTTDDDLLAVHLPIVLTRGSRTVAECRVPWARRPRVLFAWSAGDEGVEHEVHEQKLRELLEPWKDGDEVPLTVLGGVSVDKLEQALVDHGGTPFTHVHILAHGEPSADGDDVELAFLNTVGRKQTVDRKRLADAICSMGLAEKDRPAVVTLANCYSGKVQSVVDISATIGEELLRKGVPLVIASQFQLSEPGAIAMVESLYGDLLSEVPVDPRLALLNLRKALKNDGAGFHDWASIVAYANLPTDVDQSPEAPGQGQHVPLETYLTDFACSDFSEFDSTRVHCVVVSSEGEKRAAAKFKDNRVTPLFARTQLACKPVDVREQILAECRQYWSRQAESDASDGQARSLETSELQFAEVSVIDAFASWDHFDRAVRAMCWADIAVFDITNAELGVMMLLGIRAAVRRGVSVCSTWSSGDKPASTSTKAEDPMLPFNIQNLSLSQRTNDDTADYNESLGKLVIEGCAEMRELPHYLDLPAFDALRTLGTSAKSAKPITRDERVLVLCPFDPEYSRENYERHLRANLRSLLGKAEIERLGDDDSPRVVSQKLYEGIRRIEMCIVDWTRYRPNVLFELGVRLATSSLGAVQILEESDDLLDADEHAQSHVVDMLELFEPTRYKCDFQDEPFIEMVKQFDAMKQRHDSEDSNHGRVYRTVVAAIDGSDPGREPVHDYLSRTADLMLAADTQSQGGSQVLYRENKRLSSRDAAAARELRLAAWLYLEHRLNASQSHSDDLLEQYAALGKEVAGSLMAPGATDEDEQLAVSIFDRAKAATEAAVIQKPEK